MYLSSLFNHNPLKRLAPVVLFASFAISPLCVQTAQAREKPMYALVVRMKAKPGKENMLKEFLHHALPMAQSENGTLHWFAAQGESGEIMNDFFIFDTFHDEAGREAHLKGKIAEELMAKADDLLVSKPVIEKVKILAAK